MNKSMAKSQNLILKQVEKAFRLQESLFAVEQRVAIQKMTR